MGRTLALLALALAACGSDLAPPSGPEEALRDRLGIPRDAERVVLFQQSAHLDIDWQRSFDGYYATYVDDIFHEARTILDGDRRARFAVTEMAYLERHVAAHPEELGPLHSHARAGALRIVGGAMTSPDTLLPETEMLARDLLFGARFSEDVLGARAHVAYLPDSFGHAATVPDLLAAAGDDAVAFARLDGSPSIFETLVASRDHFHTGSDAESLANMGTADFVWRGPGGGEVLAHWMASGFYCTGDSIDYKDPGGVTTPGQHLGAYYGDDPSYTDGQIDAYISALSPYAKTPYLFVPIGCDFQHPKPQLLQYLDGYNQRRYGTTHAWVALATLEEYEQFISFHKDSLPVITADLTPQFMGFYGSRADVKRGTRDALAPFLAAEPYAAAIGDGGRAILDGAAGDLSLLARSDHHDFLPGTSSNDVVAHEELPLLDGARRAGERVLGAVVDRLAAGATWPDGALVRLIALAPASTTSGSVVEAEVPRSLLGRTLALADGSGAVEIADRHRPRSATLRVALDGMEPLSWRPLAIVAGTRAVERRVHVQFLDGTGAPARGAAITSVILTSPHARASFTRRASGFALTSLLLDGSEAIAAPSFLVRDYDDQGGLWRLGHEMPGCAFTERAPADGSGETVSLVEDSALVARVSFTDDTTGATREAAVDAVSAGLDLALVTGAAPGTTRTAVFALSPTSGASATTLRTGIAAGWVDRPVEKVYAPTFWPAVDWAAVDGNALLLRQSTGVRFAQDGTLELLAARWAPSEMCDNLGGSGDDPGTHRIEWRITHAASPVDAARAAQEFDRPARVFLVGDGLAQAPQIAPGSLAHLDGPGVITALKPATRGAGIIVRVLLLDSGAATLTLDARFAGAHLHRADLAERDTADLGSVTGPIALDRDHDGALVTLRVE